ncbi:Mechanosensitive ion channel-domain-containing protein [Butyriboletus roseoflavus]|nr:Mechanosensitive ion channel-domain-containing protein [Butyriboletus roseoflavus]
MRQNDDVVEDSEPERRRRDDVTDDDLSRFAYKASSRAPSSVDPAPSQPPRLARKDTNTPDPQLAQLSKCIACGLQWTSRKTAKQKRTHIEKCAKKNALSKNTIKILIEKEFAVLSPTQTTRENATSTLMASVVPVKKPKRQQVVPTVKSLPETRESILDRARDILQPTKSRADPQPIQQFSQSTLAPRNAQQPKRPALLDVNRFMEELPLTQPFGASSLRGGMTSERSLDSCEEPSFPPTQQFGASMFAQDYVLSNDPGRVSAFVCFYLTPLISEPGDSSLGQSRGDSEKGSDCDIHVQVESDTSTNTSDEFDWDEESSGAEEETHRGKHARRGRALWLAFMKLTRPVRTLLVGVIGTAFFITPLLVVDLKYQSSGGVRPQVHAWSLWLSIIWAASCATYLVVDVLPDTIVTIILLLGGQVERLKTQVELTLAVSAWLKLLLDVSWAWIALSVIQTYYDPPGSYWIIINRVLQALFTAAVILFVEKLFLRFVAINFHQHALADRLAENRLGLKALDLLSNAHPVSTNRKTTHGKKGSRNALSSIGATLDLGGLTGAWTHRKNSNGATTSSSLEVSPAHEQHESDAHHPPEKKKRRRGLSRAETRRRRRKFMASIIVDQLGGAIGQVALKNSKFHKDVELGGLHSARKLAKKLFEGLKATSPERSHLIVEDFYPYFRSTSEAHAAFTLFDKDENGDISRQEMREAVQRIYRERKALTASLKDVDSAVAKLDAVLVCIALLFIVFACLLIFNQSNTLASLVPLATIILGFSFIFGHSAQTLFESLIFIFSTHVFDVGDLVMIDEQYLVVKEFGLFSTIFRRVDGQEIIVPNSLLSSTKLVHNMRRSTSMWESTTITISYNTSLEIVEQLKQRIQAYVVANSREWSGCSVNIDKMEYQNAIYLTISIEHRSNWQDWGGRWARRNAFMRHLKTILEELDLRYTLPIQPVLLPSETGALAPDHVRETKE